MPEPCQCGEWASKRGLEDPGPARDPRPKPPKKRPKGDSVKLKLDEEDVKTKAVETEDLKTEVKTRELTAEPVGEGPTQESKPEGDLPAGSPKSSGIALPPGALQPGRCTPVPSPNHERLRQWKKPRAPLTAGLVRPS